MNFNKSKIISIVQILAVYLGSYSSWLILLFIIDSSGILTTTKLILLFSIFLFPVPLGIFGYARSKNLLLVLAIHIIITYILGWLLYSLTPDTGYFNSFMTKGLKQFEVLNLEFAISVILTKITVNKLSNKKEQES